MRYLSTKNFKYSEDNNNNVVSKKGFEVTGIQKTPNLFTRFYLPISNLFNQNLNKFRERNTLRSEIDSFAEVSNRDIVLFVVHYAFIICNGKYNTTKRAWAKQTSMSSTLEA